jgi:hypothetical protein
MGSHVQVTPGGNKQKKPRAAASEGPLQLREPFAVKPRPLKARPGLNFDKIEELLDEAEGPCRL